MPCSFCTDTTITDRQLIENDYAIAFLNQMPIVIGHTLIIPKRCVGTMAELTPEELQGVLDLKLKVRDLFLKSNQSEGFNYAWNEGQLAGQSVNHFHLHVLPRKTGDTGITEYEPRKFLYRPNLPRPISPEEELRNFARLLRNLI